MTIGKTEACENQGLGGDTFREILETIKLATGEELPHGLWLMSILPDGRKMSLRSWLNHVSEFSNVEMALAPILGHFPLDDCLKEASDHPLGPLILRLLSQAHCDGTLRDIGVAQLNLMLLDDARTTFKKSLATTNNPIVMINSILWILRTQPDEPEYSQYARAAFAMIYADPDPIRREMGFRELYELS